MRRLLPALLALLAAAMLAGCGGGGGSNALTVQQALVYKLVRFAPSGPVVPGKPVTVTFAIQQPDGTTLTDYKTGAGPHVGVHLIIVRHDLAYIIHRHPPIAADGTLRQQVVFPAPGDYHVVIDAYPNTTGPVPNFQLFQTIHVTGAYHAQPLPPPTKSEVVDGYHFKIVKVDPSGPLKAIQASLMTITVTDPSGKPAVFKPWYGALAHAIFFRQGSLAYFHTHICAPNAVGCTSVLGGSTVSGSSTTPGVLHAGVLLPVSGTWRLFLQLTLGGKVVTAPFTLVVR